MSPESHRRFDPRILTNARELRANTVPAEHKLWQRLRNRQLGGLKFRRQVPVGKFIADFICHEARLLIEVDGPSHEQREQYDSRRTDILETHDFRVIRFLNEDVHRNLDDVCRTILRECEPLVD